MTNLTKEIRNHWTYLKSYLIIRDERDYDQAIRRLNELLDEIGENAQHPLFDLLDTLGTLIHAYEEKHHPMPECSGAEMLQYLMAEHDLSQSELPEVGSQGVVSEILTGKRQLNVRQIRELAERFEVSPAVFIY